MQKDRHGVYIQAKAHKQKNIRGRKREWKVQKARDVKTTTDITAIIIKK